MTAAVIDASVVVAWASSEPDGDRFEPLFAKPNAIEAPDLLLIETAHGLLRKAGRGLIAASVPLSIVRTLQAGRIVWHPWQQLLEAAVGLAVALRHPVTDCCYLLVASRQRLPLATLDRRLAAKAADMPNGGVALWQP